MNGSSGSGLLDWNDARIFIAVARHGSLRAAGRALGISQPTFGRRIAAFEAVFGGPTLFDRLPEGLRLNEAGAALLPVAEQLEDAALSLERHRAAASSVLSGTVRISVGEWAAAFLSHHVGSSSEEQAHFPMPRWVEQHVRETGASVAFRASDMPMHLTAIRAGAGRGILPCFIADEDPLLERVAPPMPETSCEYWLIVHRDLRRAACVRAIMDWVQSLFRSERDRLAGLS